MLNENFLKVILWTKGKEEGFDWDFKTPEEISLILKCGVITNSFNDDDLINRPYEIVGHSYNILNKDNNKIEVNIYLEKITENVKFYRTRG